MCLGLLIAGTSALAFPFINSTQQRNAANTTGIIHVTSILPSGKQALNLNSMKLLAGPTCDKLTTKSSFTSNPQCKTTPACQDPSNQQCPYNCAWVLAGQGEMSSSELVKLFGANVGCFSTVTDPAPIEGNPVIKLTWAAEKQAYTSASPAQFTLTYK